MEGSESRSRTQGDLEACGKLWEVYATEAKQYDEGLVKSWKEDMDVTLVFSGLYSAVLTAFVIESYQTLQPNSADASAMLLREILHQLASNSTTNSPSMNDTNDTSFRPTPSALSCNILWFSSLAMALTSAFLAMMIQQWARKFLHRTSMARSPRTQAYMVRFLYFGLKELGMHTIVDIIPLLLHMSLFSFFAGLIAFFQDVNPVLKWIFVAVLTLSIAVYSGLTVLPTIRPNSPYTTPLSPVAWKLALLLQRATRYLSMPGSHRVDLESQMSGSGYPAKSTPMNDNLTKVTMLVAEAQRNVTQESSCIAWTLRSLNDEEELLRFLEAVPDVLLEEHRLRISNLYLLRPLLEATDPQVNIISRSYTLMKNSRSPWFNEAHRTRCNAVCTKVIYAIGRVLLENPSLLVSPVNDVMENGPHTWFSLNMIDSLRASPHSIAGSAVVLCAVSICQSIREAIPNLKLADAIRISLELKQRLFGSRYPSLQVNARSVRVRTTQNQNSIDFLFRTIDQVTLHCMIQYLNGAIDHYPEEFEVVWDILMRTRDENQKRRGAHSTTEPRSSNSPIGDIIRLMDESNTPILLTKTDILLGAVLDIASPSLADCDLISRCLTKRVKQAGWGATSSFWKEQGRLQNVLNVLRSRYFRTISDEDQYATLRELILYGTIAGDEFLFAFLAEMWASLGRQELKTLVSLAAYEASPRLFSDIPSAAGIIELSLQELNSKPEFQGLADLPDHWRILLHFLSTGPSNSEIRNVLQFFTKYPLPRCGIPDVAFSNYAFLTVMMAHTEDFHTRWISSPKVELLDINTTIWCIWEMIFWLWSDNDLHPVIFNLGNEVHSMSMASLLTLSTQWLNEESRARIEFVKLGSTERERHTIVSRNLGRHRELIPAVTAAQGHILENVEFFIGLPPMDDREGLDLISDD